MPLDRPTAEELLDAISEYLQATAAKPNAFHNRIANNLIQLLKREFKLGAIAEQAEHRRLAALLDQQKTLPQLHQQLCDKIRSGEMDWRNTALLQHLRATTADKLRIDNPAYLENNPLST